MKTAKSNSLASIHWPGCSRFQDLFDALEDVDGYKAQSYMRQYLKLWPELPQTPKERGFHHLALVRDGYSSSIGERMFDHEHINDRVLFLRRLRELTAERIEQQIADQQKAWKLMLEEENRGDYRKTHDMQNS